MLRSKLIFPGKIDHNWPGIIFHHPPLHIANFLVLIYPSRLTRGAQITASEEEWEVKGCVREGGWCQKMMGIVLSKKLNWKLFVHQWKSMDFVSPIRDCPTSKIAKYLARNICPNTNRFISKQKITHFNNDNRIMLCITEAVWPKSRQTVLVKTQALNNIFICSNGKLSTTNCKCNVGQKWNLITTYHRDLCRQKLFQERALLIKWLDLAYILKVWFIGIIELNDFDQCIKRIKHLIRH